MRFIFNLDSRLIYKHGAIWTIKKDEYIIEDASAEFRVILLLAINGYTSII